MGNRLTELEWWEMVRAYYSLGRNKNNMFGTPGPEWATYSTLSDRLSDAQHTRWGTDEMYPRIDSLDDNGVQRMRAMAQDKIDRLNAKARLQDGKMVSAWLKG